jgi:2-methylisocitrate lyase-like PEP mutase family enzyme
VAGDCCIETSESSYFVTAHLSDVGASQIFITYESDLHMMSKAQEFRDRWQQDDVLVCPGAHDPMTARIIDQSDCDAMHMTGFGTTLSKTGYPDVGLASMTEVVENARQMSMHVDVPLFCDADDGYGDVKNTIRTVEQFLQTDVAGIHIEDQTSPKRGIIGDHKIVPEEEFVQKIRAACDTRDKHNGDIVIAARSDAPGARNGTLDDAISRMNKAADVGADLGMVLGQANKEEVKRLGREVDIPLVYDWNGYHPRLDTETLKEYGYELLICSMLSTRATMLNVYHWAEKLQNEGLSATYDLLEGFDNIDVTFEEFAGFPEAIEWEQTYKSDQEQ